jgi:nitrate reductase gamma subunit
MTVTEWIEFAKGPLFTLTFLIMILGLARQVVLQIHQLVGGKGRRLRNAPWKVITKDAMSWVVPVKHVLKGAILFSIASYLFHIGAILVPLLLRDHIVLWEDLLGVSLPSLSRGVADGLTLFTIACILLLLGFRIFGVRQRAMSSKIDYIILLLILLPFVSGFLASHPSVNPLRWEVAMLTHLLSAELLFVMIPFTKLAHIVLFAFDRISAVHWQLRPGAGDKVAEALFGEEARV